MIATVDDCGLVLTVRNCWTFCRFTEGYVVPGVHSLGGAYHPHVGDVMTCYRACAASSRCAAVDFDSIDNSCWFHAGPTTCRRVEAAPSTLQIRRRRDCSLASWRHARTCCTTVTSLAGLDDFVVTGKVVGDGRLADRGDDDARVDDVQCLTTKTHLNGHIVHPL